MYWGEGRVLTGDRRMETKTDKKDFMSYFLQAEVMEKVGFGLVVFQALAFV